MQSMIHHYNSFFSQSLCLITLIFRRNILLPINSYSTYCYHSVSIQGQPRYDNYSVLCLHVHCMQLKTYKAEQSNGVGVLFKNYPKDQIRLSSPSPFHLVNEIIYYKYIVLYLYTHMELFLSRHQPMVNLQT